jgi:hypothetical protein
MDKPGFSPMVFGFDCNDGWFDLLDETLEKIKTHVLNNYLPDLQNYTVRQIKEKWGGLRIELSVYDSELEKICDDAEAASFKICEVCGTKENIGYTTENYYLTICYKCFTLDTMIKNDKWVPREEIENKLAEKRKKSSDDSQK